MQTILNVKDETAFGFGGAEHFFTLDFPSNRITVRELIEKRVREEVKKHNSTETPAFRRLVEPTFSERFPNGIKFKEKKHVNWREQYETACEAFERNGFIVLVDELQMEDLNQIIEIEPGTSVTFFKLVPLVGG